MTLVLNRKTGNYEGDLRVPGVRRLHISFRTKLRKKAEPLHAAVELLMREGDADLVDLLRAGTITVESVARCVRDRQPFSTLRPGATWPTVAEAAEQYVAWLAGHSEREASTAENARSVLALYVARFYDQRLDRVAHDAAAEWQQGIVGGYSVNYAQRVVHRVDAMYRFHARQEQRAAAHERRAARDLASPLDPATRPTRTTTRERYLSPDEAAALLAHTPDALLAPVAACLLAGLRVEEALHLRVGVDVQLERAMLAVQARGTKGKPGYWRPKSGKRREVPITPDLGTILARHVARYAGEVYLVPAARRGRGGAEVPMPANTFREHFALIVGRAGLTYGRSAAAGVVVHTLRHTFASWLVSRDVNPFRVAKLLGNSLAMVEKVYGHLSPADNRAAVALLSGALPLPTPPEDA